MALSIIIPCLNEAAHIVDTLTSLQDLRRQGHQLILSDGGSKDQTRELAAPLVDRLVQAPGGRARQMNAAARLADHDILWFVHADSRPPARADRLILRSLASGHVWGRFDVRLSGHSWAFRIIERLMNIRSCITGIATGDQGIFVQKHIFQQLGGYQDIPLMEDIQLSRELKKISPPACIREKLITSSRRWEQRGIIPTILLMWRLRLAYFLGVSADKLARDYR